MPTSLPAKQKRIFEVRFSISESFTAQVVATCADEAFERAKRSFLHGEYDSREKTCSDGKMEISDSNGIVKSKPVFK